MSYDPDDYTVDGGRLVAGFGLAGMALFGLIIVGCPATPSASPLEEEASYRPAVAWAGRIHDLRPVDGYVA
ncbi:hypothetical protein [Rhizobium ecuadorense]|uniref:hypothetical protein n=1 Tax=Rhizobium ecuadorense TaxID=1671795 RepID=UPI000673C2E7|nr:hypothetical protein [Rhizobium ecuadorense]